MSVIILGGGIGGLTLAHALLTHNIPATVYEAAPHFKPLGAGIIMAPNALTVFERLGLRRTVEDSSARLSEFWLTDERRKKMGSVATQYKSDQFSGTSVCILRGQLHDILQANLPQGTINFGKRAVDITPIQNGALVSFADGSEVRGSLIVGADGIHSMTRKLIFPDVKLRYSGQTCWRGIAPFDLSTIAPQTAIEAWGVDGLRIGLVPLINKQTYWYATQVTEAGGKDEGDDLAGRIGRKYAHFFNPVQEILSSTPSDAIMRHDMSDFEPLSTWSKDNIVLLGDAAHAMTPNMGQGAAQSIEDGLALALAFAGTKTQADALARYEQMRHKKATDFVKRSWSMGKMAGLNNRPLGRIRNVIMRTTPKRILAKQAQQIFDLTF